MSMNMTSPTVSVKKYFVVKWMGDLSDHPGLTYVPSKWLCSYLDHIIFIRYPFPIDNYKIEQLIIENSPASNHWKPHMAAFYYQTDSLEDAILFASYYVSPPQEAQSDFVSTSTSIQNTISNESFSSQLLATNELTLEQQLNIIQPLVSSVCQSIKVTKK